MFYPLFYYSLATAQADADAAQSRASDAKQQAMDAKMDADLLRMDVERLLMITESLWTFLKQQHGYTEEDLVKMITEIDMRDGKLDNRVAPSGPHKCPNCGQVMNRNRVLCYYCGKPMQIEPFAR
jgi:ribosomal protein L32